METNIKDRWRTICNEYLLLFCNKHGIQYKTDTWVVDNPGTIVEVGDMYVHMDDIRYDVDNNIQEDYFEKWYYKGLEVYELTGRNYMNYESFCKGAPDYYTPEKMEEIKRAKARVQAAQEALEASINNMKNQQSLF